MQYSQSPFSYMFVIRLENSNQEYQTYLKAMTSFLSFLDLLVLQVTHGIFEKKIDNKETDELKLPSGL